MLSGFIVSVPQVKLTDVTSACEHLVRHVNRSTRSKGGGRGGGTATQRIKIKYTAGETLTFEYISGVNSLSIRPGSMNVKTWALKRSFSLTKRQSFASVCPRDMAPSMAARAGLVGSSYK